MKDQWILKLKPEIQIKHSSKKALILSSSATQLTWNFPSPSLRLCLQQLQDRGKSESDLAGHWRSKDSLPYFFYFLQQLKKRAFLSYSVSEKGRILATLIPVEKDPFSFDRLSGQELNNIQLSRFAYVRNKEGSLILESPLINAEIHIKDPGFLHLIYAIATPKTLDFLKKECAHFSEKALIESIFLLKEAHFLEELNPSLQTWEFHDLLFHSKSRSGRHSSPLGATFRFLKTDPPSPVLGNFSSNPLIFLDQPDMFALRKQGPSFTHVLEARKSIRDHGSPPISFKQLSHFLYQAARIKELKKSEHYEVSRRPYPGGGACYELEVYPLIHHCQGIERGVYHYHPEHHALDFCKTWSASVEKLFLSAKHATGKEDLPQILILLTARFHRVNWKYQSMAYSVILKNVGSLIQTMYLVATAMDLAPCAVGCSNADLFSEVLGTDYYQESSVGEFILGS